MTSVTEQVETRELRDGRATTEVVSSVVEEAGDRFESFGRVGWLAKGVVYATIGILFLRIAIGDDRGTDEQANQAGAVEAVAETSAGRALLVILGVGLALYACWRLFTVILPGDWTGRALLDRGGYLVSTVIYTVLLVTIVGMLRTRRHTADQREDRMVEDLVKDVLSVPAGRLLVALAGVAVIVVGVVFAHKGVTRSFRKELAARGSRPKPWLEWLGTAGWIARGISMGLIGAFLIRAAWVHDPEEAAGLDDSIRQLTGSWWGVVLALVVGVGFVVYGLFAGLSANRRVLHGPCND